MVVNHNDKAVRGQEIKQANIMSLGYFKLLGAAATKGAGNIRSVVKLGNNTVLFNLRMTSSLITIVRNSMVPFMPRRESF